MLKKIKILKVIGWLVFASLILLFAVIISPVLSIPGVPRAHVVVTGSMEPTIPVGSIVFTQDVDPRSLVVGDIVAFESPNQAGDTILHRINAIKSTDPLLFETKGDTNDAPDAWDVVEVGVLGKYLFAIPYLGHAAAYIRTPLGFAIMIGLPALLFIISQVLNIKKAIRQEIKKGIKGKTKKSKDIFPIIFLFIVASTFLLSVKSIQALYTDTVTVSGLTLSVKDFVAPAIPQLLSPANNSYQNTSGLVMDWSDVTDYEDQHNPVYYIYQSFRNLPSGSPVYTSGKLGLSNIPAPGTPDGVYYWHVKACDTLDNCSDWSDSWKVTVDSTPPTLPQNLNYLNPNLPCGNITTSLSITPNWDNSLDQNFSHYEYQSYNPPKGWLWSTIVPQSQYSGTFSQGYGVYGFRIRAVDMAGNKSDWTSTGFDDSCQITYIPVFTDMQLGFETVLTQSLIEAGSCPVYANDLSANSDASSLQILKWHLVTGATKYRVSSYKFENGNFINTGQYILASTNPKVTIETDIFTYTTFATSPGTYTYFVEALDSQDHVLGHTTEVTSDYACTFTVDRTPPVTHITNTDYATNNPNINIDYTITDTNPDFVTLYYSFDLGSWKEGDSDSSGSIPFVASGDGVYCFDTVGQDLAGNVETVVLPDPVTANPVDPNLYCVQLDQTDPVSIITSPVNSANNQADITISSWDGRIEGMASDSGTLGLDHVEISIQKDLADFWNGSAWVSGTEDSVRTIVSGTMVWFYQFSSVPDPGTYAITSHAVDKVGNIENSAIITFTYQPDQIAPDGIQISSFYNSTTNYLSLSFSNIPSVFGDDPDDELSYDLTYISNGVEKGLFSQIFPNTVVLGQSTKSYYVGSCTSNGTCNPDPLDSLHFNIDLIGQISGKNVTINQTLP